MRDDVTPWKPEEVEFVKANLHLTARQIGKALGRTKASIQSKARQLGLLEQIAHHQTPKKLKPIIEIEQGEPFIGRVSLYDIKNNQCRYTRDTGANMLLCGADCERGETYCAEHRPIVNPKRFDAEYMRFVNEVIGKGYWN